MQRDEEAGRVVSALPLSRLLAAYEGREDNADALRSLFHLCVRRLVTYAELDAELQDRATDGPLPDELLYVSSPSPRFGDWRGPFHQQFERIGRRDYLRLLAVRHAFLLWRCRLCSEEDANPVGHPSDYMCDVFRTDALRRVSSDASKRFAYDMGEVAASPFAAAETYRGDGDASVTHRRTNVDESADAQEFNYCCATIPLAVPRRLIAEGKERASAMGRACPHPFEPAVEARIRYRDERGDWDVWSWVSSDDAFIVHIYS